MAPTCGSGRRAQHKDSGLRRLVCPGESCPPALALKPDRRLLPTRPWWLLSCCPCAGARAPSLRRRVRWPFKRNAWDSLASVPPASVPPASVPPGLHSQKGGDLSSWPGTLGWDIVGAGPLAPQGPPQPGQPCRFLPATRGSGPAWSVSLPSYHLHVAASACPRWQDCRSARCPASGWWLCSSAVILRWPRRR